MLGKMMGALERTMGGRRLTSKAPLKMMANALKRQWAHCDDINLNLSSLLEPNGNFLIKNISIKKLLCESYELTKLWDWKLEKIKKIQNFYKFDTSLAMQNFKRKGQQQALLNKLESRKYNDKRYHRLILSPPTPKMFTCNQT
jgi:hypothetical protein